MGCDRGYTMIELLVVMVVLSFGVLGVLQTTLLAARLERRSSSITSGTLLAQERLERIGALGWERATAGLASAALPETLGMGGLLLQEQVSRPGGRFLLVYQREPQPEDPPLCTVHCFREGDRGGFDPRPVAHLSLRRRR